MDLESVKQWANENEGFLALIFGLLGIFSSMFFWKSGFPKGILNKIKNWKTSTPAINIEKGRMLNPHIKIYKCSSYYIQVGKFKYKHVLRYKLRIEDDNVNSFCMRYLWDGSEKKYVKKAYEFLDNGRVKRKLSIAEVNPRDEIGQYIFAVNFRPIAEGGAKERDFIISFEKLSDKKKQGSLVSAVTPLNDGYESLDMKVVLKENVIFKKRIDQIHLNYCSPGDEVVMVDEPTNEISWFIGNNINHSEEINTHRRYCIVWK